MVEPSAIVGPDFNPWLVRVEETSDFTAASLLSGLTTRFRVNASSQQYIRTESLWSDEDELLSSLPHEERGGLRLCLLFVIAAAVYGSVQSDVPRVILMDHKPGTMNNFCAETFGQPFRPDHFVSGQTGASNNRTKGHHVESAELISSTLCWMWQGRRRRTIASKVSSCATLLVELVPV